MIRDIRWAYELGFKRGWKVGHRRGRKANLVGYNAGLDFDAVSNVNEEPLIQRNLVKGFSFDTVSFDTESAKERKPKTYAEYLWRERTEELNPSDLETKVEQSDIRASDSPDVLPTNECDHFIHIVPTNIRERDEVFYCPKCGEKL